LSLGVGIRSVSYAVSALTLAARTAALLDRLGDQPSLPLRSLMRSLFGTSGNAARVTPHRSV
jgi:hypothetical protein